MNRIKVLITLIIVANFLCQNVVWAKVNYYLAPESKVEDVLQYAREIEAKPGSINIDSVTPGDREKIFSAPIDCLEFSTRAKNIIKEAGIHTIGELVQTADPVRWSTTMRNINRITSQEIEKVVTRLREIFDMRVPEVRHLRDMSISPEDAEWVLALSVEDLRYCGIALKVINKLRVGGITTFENLLKSGNFDQLVRKRKYVGAELAKLKELVFKLRKKLGLAQRLNVGVIGGTGTVGSQLIRSLLSEDDIEKVHTMLRSAEPDALRKVVSTHQGVEINHGDLTNRTSLRNMVKNCDVVYLLGGWSGLGKIDPGVALEVNVRAPALICQLARQYNTRIVFASTVHSYSLSKNKSGLVKEDDLVPEDDVREAVDYYYHFIKNSLSQDDMRQIPTDRLPERLTKGANLYCLTKLIAERFLMDYSNGIVLRFSNIYGPGDREERAVPKFLMKLAGAESSAEEVTFVPGRQNSYIYVGDVVRAVIKAGDVPIEPNSKIITVAHPQTVTQEKLFLLIKEVTDSPATVAAMSENLMRKLGLSVPPAISFDVTRLQEKLGITVGDLTGIREGLAITKRWLIDTDEDQKWLSINSSV